MIEINGKTGPYNLNSIEGYSRNAAYNFMKLSEQNKEKEKTVDIKNIEDIEFENVQYSNLKNASADEYIKCAKIFSQESIKCMDKNNGRVEKDEFITQNTPAGMKPMLEKFFDVVDLNKDGAIDEDENTALIISMDSAIISDDLTTVKIEKPDGYINSKNKMNTDKYILQFPDKARDLLNAMCCAFAGNCKVQ